MKKENKAHDCIVNRSFLNVFRAKDAFSCAARALGFRDMPKLSMRWNIVFVVCDDEVGSYSLLSSFSAKRRLRHELNIFLEILEDCWAWRWWWQILVMAAWEDLGNCATPNPCTLLRKNTIKKDDIADINRAFVMVPLVSAPSDALIYYLMTSCWLINGAAITPHSSWQRARSLPFTVWFFGARVTVVRCKSYFCTEYTVHPPSKKNFSMIKKIVAHELCKTLTRSHTY